MKVNEIVSGFIIVFPVVLVVSLIVSYLYSLIAHGTGVADLESSVRFGIILGIALPVIRLLDRKKGT